ncbi:MAG: LPXTG cell wall anchor domain-containing protein [Tyzzerella sp.]|nr:LPXTG cell wall anchor domain-containing protein [Tyzzerella sp.]
MKKKLKRIGVSLLAVLTLVMGMLSGITNVFAADEDTMGKAFIEDCDKAGYKDLGGGVYALYSDIECTNELARVTTVKGDDVYLGTFPAGMYYLKQIKAPDGYVLKSAPDEYEIYAGRSKSTWIMNTEQKGSLYIYHEGEKLVGWDGTNFVYENHSIGQNAVKITAAEDVYSANGTLVYSKGDVVKERVEGSRTGSTVIKGLTHGTYAVTELEDMEGYRKNSEPHIVTLKYGNPELTESYNSLTIYNERQKATLIAHTEDKVNGIQLQEGSYTMYAGADIRNIDGEIIVTKGVALQTIQTNDEGDAIFTIDIPQNREVYVMQSEAPTGYTRNVTEKQSFLFNCSAYEDSKDVTVHKRFGNDRTTAKIQLCIVDAGTGEAKPEGNASFEGAVYGLYAREDIVSPDGVYKRIFYHADDLVTTFTTDEKGEAVVSDLHLGKYYTKQLIASEGYRVDEKEREVNCNYEGDMVAEVSRRVESHQIVKSQPIQVIIGAQHKENTEAELLEGAGFMMYLKSQIPLKEDGSYDFENATPVPIGDYGELELLTGEDGSIFTYSLPYGTYVVVESTTPEKTETVEPFEVEIVNNSPKQPQVWHLLTVRYIDETPEIPKDDPIETPTEQPKEEPEEEPTDTPNEKPIETPTEKPTDNTSPKTGDDSQNLLWGSVILLSLGALLLLLFKKKK